MNVTEPHWIASPWVYWTFAGGAAAVGLFALWFALWRDRSRGRPRCPRCWYSMKGVVSDDGSAPSEAGRLVCPECGHDAGTPQRLYKTRRRRGWALAALLLLVLSWYSYHVRDRMLTMRESWATAAIPTTALAAAIPWLDEAEFDVIYTRYRDDDGQSRLWLWQDWLVARGCIVVFEDEGRTERMRRYAGNWLGDLGRRVDAPIAPLIDALDDPAMDVRRTAAWSVGKVGPRAVAAAPALIAIIESDDKEVHSGALDALGRIGAGQFEGMSDDRLAQVLAAIGRHDSVFGETIARPRDLYLHEMIHRSTPAAGDRLRKMIASAPNSDFSEGRVDLELTTALRRIEGKPDPLRIELVEPAELVCTAPKLPEVKVRIVNVDAEGAAVGYQRGGDYRGGRPGRWRFEVRDADGKAWPVRTNTIRMGGISGFGPLKHGDFDEMPLDMNAFIDPLPPGEYTVVIQYHNSLYLSDEQDVSNLIISTSEPVPFTVKPPD